MHVNNYWFYLYNVFVVYFRVKIDRSCLVIQTEVNQRKPSCQRQEYSMTRRQWISRKSFCLIIIFMFWKQKAEKINVY